MIAINELEDMATFVSSTNYVAIAETNLDNDAATTPQTSATPAAGSASPSDRWASSLIVELLVNNVTCASVCSLHLCLSVFTGKIGQFYKYYYWL